MVAMREPEIDRRAEFTERLGRHRSQLFGYIYSLVRDLDDADDLFQQTSLVLWEKFDRYDPEKRFLSWACGVARFEVLNFLRGRGRRRLVLCEELAELLIEAHDDRESELAEDRRAALADCLKNLGPKDVKLLDDCYGRPARIPDVAREWGRSSQSIHNSLRRIRQALFECVRRSLGD
jgi:RNA polymerase sigma-70 factor (ECF subfamily)